MNLANYNVLNPARLFESTPMVKCYNMSMSMYMKIKDDRQKVGLDGSFYKFAMLTNKN